MARDLSGAVVDFVYRYVESLDVLEVLTRLAGQPEREWTAAEIAGKVGIPSARALDILAALYYKGLAECAEGAYRFHPRDPEIQRAFVAFARAHGERPSAVIREIAALGSARSFADAFNLRTPKSQTDG